MYDILATARPSWVNELSRGGKIRSSELGGAGSKGVGDDDFN